MIERWKDIKGYEGMYRISNNGRVKSLCRVVINCNNSPRPVPERILKPSEDRTGGGYLFVKLCNKEIVHNPKVHRLVAEAFIPNPENKPQVNHKDGDKLNNHVSNLEWCTSKENVRHSWDNGLQIPLRGKLNGNNILTEKQVLKIRKEGNKKLSHRELGIKYGVHDSTIGKILTNRVWKHLIK